MGEKTDRIRRPERSPCLVMFARVALHVLEWEGCARELRPSCTPPSRKLQDVRYDELDDHDASCTSSSNANVDLLASAPEPVKTRIDLL